ncbi:MAG: UDP-N-acetylglucosamine 1-carboxyvinyltransferase [bacterium]|nr:UDP-N-acetylglucosamine 1-carboxyvinyltransferase [bacterium]
MAKFIINGPNRLKGTYQVVGSKNAALPIMAACLLTDQQVILKNVPDISDVQVMAEILRQFGAKIKIEQNSLCIKADSVNPRKIPDNLSGHMRASILILGAAISRFGKIDIAYPGGDIIGARPIDTHLEAFEALGIKIDSQDNTLKLKNYPKSNKVILKEISVTSTENIVMASVLTKGITEIRLAACEPHVADLCNFLNSLGAKISGVGSHILKIEGVNKLTGGEWRIVPDQLEAGTIAIAAAASRSEVVIRDFVVSDNDALINKFDEIGVNYKKITETEIVIKPTAKLKATNIRTDIYPGFQSDLQAPMAVLLTQAIGNSEIFETLYEGRLNYLYELARMGANTTIKETHIGIVSGPTPLSGTELISFDIRAGATLILAGLIAEGKTIIDRAEHIDRGYENFDKKLRSLGANIKRLP